MTNRQPQTTPGQALGTLAAFVLGLVAFGGLVWYVATLDKPWTASLAVVWAYLAKKVLDYGVGRVLALGRAEQAKALEQELNTGVWKAHEAGTFTIRHDPRAGTWHVQGWTGPFTEYRTEVPWADPATLWRMVEEAEAEGMVPGDDDATRRVRTLLMIQAGAQEAVRRATGRLGIYPRDDS